MANPSLRRGKPGGGGTRLINCKLAAPFLVAEISLMRILILTISFCLAAVDVMAQPAVTVQLPTFSFATVSTTVNVPDGGATYMGGINCALSGRTEYGVPGLPFLVSRTAASARTPARRVTGQRRKSTTLTPWIRPC